jgi:hypothetical protein
MITDNNLTLSGSYSNGVWTGQSIAQVVGTYVSTNVIDLASLSFGAAPNQPNDYGAGKQLIVAFSIVTALAGGGATVTFQLVDADDAAISVNPEVLVQTAAIPVANLGLGALVPLTWDRAAPFNPRRYFAARYVIAGATTTTGAVVANVVETIDDVKFVGAGAYKSGFAVL